MPSSRYHHGHLRSALVEEGVRVAREGGPEGLVLRELARRVGVSHNAAYRHFAHRDDLVAAVGEQAMAALVDAMRTRLDAVHETDPVRRARLRLTSVGLAYVEYALSEPGLYRVAFATHGGVGSDPPPESGPYELLTATLDDLVEVGFLAPTAREGAEEFCWSVVHGFASLAMVGPVEHDRLADQLARLLRAVDRSFAATTAARYDDLDPTESLHPLPRTDARHD